MITLEIFDKEEFLEIVLDEEDRDLAKLHWTPTGGNSRTGKYFGRKVLGRLSYLHQEILERKLGRILKPGEIPDHKDRNSLNNTRENIRLATRSQNHANNSGKRNRILPPGVGKRKGNTFQANITIEGKTTYLGNYDTPEKAHEVFKRKHFEIYGEFSPYKPET